MPGRGHVDPRRRWLRLIGILDACEWAGLAPVNTLQLHSVAYLTEALARVWELEPIEAAVIKREVGPYYPALQQDLDRLVGMGIAVVDALGMSADQEGHPTLEPRFSLNDALSQPILEAMRELWDEAQTLAFVNEVVQAYSRLSDEQMEQAIGQDATYGDPSIDTGEVIDLGEWVSSRSTASALAADRINKVASGRLKPAETIELYVDHIIRRLPHAK